VQIFILQFLTDVLKKASAREMGRMP